MVQRDFFYCFINADDVSRERGLYPEGNYYFMPSSSTSKINVEPGGIVPVERSP
jgi:hypothetical protein